MTYDIVTTALTVVPKDGALYSERATVVRLEDEAAGLFVVLEQTPDAGTQRVAFDVEEWPSVCQAVERLVRVCLERNRKEG